MTESRDSNLPSDEFVVDAQVPGVMRPLQNVAPVASAAGGGALGAAQTELLNQVAGASIWSTMVPRAEPSIPAWMRSALNQAETQGTALENVLLRSRMPAFDLLRLPAIFGMAAPAVSDLFAKRGSLGGLAGLTGIMPPRGVMGGLSQTATILEQMRVGIPASPYGALASHVTRLDSSYGRTLSLADAFNLAALPQSLIAANHATTKYALATGGLLSSFVQQAAQYTSLAAVPTSSVAAARELNRGLHSFGLLAQAASFWWDVRGSAVSGATSLSPWLQLAPTLQPYSAARMLAYFADTVKLTDAELEELVEEGFTTDADALYALLTDDFAPRLASVHQELVERVRGAWLTAVRESPDHIVQAAASMRVALQLLITALSDKNDMWRWANRSVRDTQPELYRRLYKKRGNFSWEARVRYIVRRVDVTLGNGSFYGDFTDADLRDLTRLLERLNAPLHQLDAGISTLALRAMIWRTVGHMTMLLDAAEM